MRALPALIWILGGGWDPLGSTSVLSDCALAFGSRASAQQCACSYCPSNCFQEGRPFAVITFSFLFPPPPSLDLCGRLLRSNVPCI